jgi:hypothetical protein
MQQKWRFRQRRPISVAGLHFVASWRGLTFGIVQERQHIAGPRLASTPLEKGGRRFDHTDLLGDGDRDPLIQRNTVFPGQSGSGFFERYGELERIGCFAHDRNSFNNSPGRRTRNPPPRRPEKFDADEGVITISWHFNQLPQSAEDMQAWFELLMKRIEWRAKAGSDENRKNLPKSPA